MTDAPIPNVIVERMSRSPQGKALGLEVVRVSPELVLKVPYRPELVGDPDSGVIAGGVVTTLLDFACGWATALALKEPTSIATLDLRIDYMRPSRPGPRPALESSMKAAWAAATGSDGSSS